ncbi:MAG TPA: hypothetical protein VFG35_28465 [Actinoplanes sp.]|nr:hypothetical protein [Actinoplanes sp.]
MTAVDRQVVLRRCSRPVYQVGAVVALVATVQAALLPSVEAAPAWFWAAVPVCAAAATVLTIKSVPYDHVKFPG